MKKKGKKKELSHKLPRWQKHSKLAQFSHFSKFSIRMTMAGQKNKKTDSDWLNLSSEFEKITESRGGGKKINILPTNSQHKKEMRVKN
jgi:hypothetical protein